MSHANGSSGDAQDVDLYGATIDSLQIDTSTIEYNTKGTIIAHKSEEAPPLQFTVGRLPQISVAHDKEHALSASVEERPMAEFAIEEEIGKGGMGLILRGMQLPLQREVAIKRILPDLDAPHVQMALLREAWITGALQHPNIVPVHALGCLPDGSPVFVMKRVSGVGWDQVIHQPEHPLLQAHQQDPLGWHLDILMQVCNAVHFAHDRGILHRDLKPENVMLGEYGEVYLLDWGIAVSTKEDNALPLPLARDCTKIMGTPAYMAPEMATCQVDMLGERTDVYLLGAILHEILTKQPKHMGQSLSEALVSVVTSAPFAYGPDVPEVLADICNRATHRDPARRYESADALRRALLHFLSCRNSIDLSTQALDTLGEVQERARKGGSDLVSDEDNRRLYELFHEANHGFRQALRIWSDNEQAAEGREVLHLAMVEYEIGQKDPKAAQLHLASLAEPPVALAEQIEALAEAERLREAQVERLKQLEFDNDLNLGRRTRAFISTVWGLLLLPYLLLFGKTFHVYTYTHACHMLTVLGFTGLALGMGIWARDTLTRTAVNRKLVRGIGVFCLLLWAQAVGAWLWEQPPPHAFSEVMLMAALFLSIWGVGLDERMLWPALLYMTTYLLSALWPPLLFEFSAIGNLCALLLVALLWRPKTLRPTPEERESMRR